VTGFVASSGLLSLGSVLLSHGKESNGKIPSLPRAAAISSSEAAGSLQKAASLKGPAGMYDLGELEKTITASDDWEVVLASAEHNTHSAYHGAPSLAQDVVLKGYEDGYVFFSNK
jgi:hypothetical protein